MKKIELKELKVIQLDILKDIHDFCMSNNIMYFLSYGTLIGAIRHNGYIPWDDDIDICMPRPDYERFINMYNKKDSPYKMCAMEIDKNYMLPFGKVHDSSTILNESLYDQDIFGVYVDVFPIDGCDEKGLLIHQSNILRRLLNTKKAVIGKKRSFAKNMLISIGKFLLTFTSIKSLLIRYKKLSCKYPYSESEFVANIMDSYYGEGEIFKKEKLSNTILHKFENFDFCIPENYDLYLKSLYGDYMQLPPIEAQVSHHTFEAWWKE